MRRAVFLDRDGVVNAMWCDPEHGTVDSPSNISQFTLLPGVPEAIRQLNHAGYLTVVVSNQPGIAKGKLSPAILDGINERMQRDLASAGARLDAVYYCLHHPDAVLEEYRVACDCRKPQPGLILRAGRQLQIDLARSFMIGDGIMDIQAGRRAGCWTIWVGHASCDVSHLMRQPDVVPDWTADSLKSAVELICQKEPHGDLP